MVKNMCYQYVDLYLFLFLMIIANIFPVIEACIIQSLLYRYLPEQKDVIIVET